MRPRLYWVTWELTDAEGAQIEERSGDGWHACQPIHLSGDIGKAFSLDATYLP